MLLKLALQNQHNQFKKVNKMKKVLTLTLLFFLITELSLSQDVKISQNSNVQNNQAAATTKDAALPQNEVDPTKQLDLVTKTLNNPAIVDNIQGEMANLLMGNKSTSLMFDERENDSIERAIDSLKNNQIYTPDQNDSENEPTNPDDQKKQQQEAEEKAKKEQEDFNQQSYIYLASIMYSTPQNWAVWINNKKITSETNKQNKELFLKSVDHDKVSVLWHVSPTKLKVLLGKKADQINFKTTADGQIEVNFALQPNQTFFLGSNSVIEGKIMTNMIKQKDENTQNTKDQEQNTPARSKTKIL